MRRSREPAREICLAFSISQPWKVEWEFGEKEAMHDITAVTIYQLGHIDSLERVF